MLTQSIAEDPTARWLWLQQGPSESGAVRNNSTGDGLAQAVTCQGKRSTVSSGG